MFNDSSPYIVDRDKLNRVNLQNSFGVTIRIKKVYLEYSHVFLSEEFNGQGNHSWGGIRIRTAF